MKDLSKTSSEIQRLRESLKALEAEKLKMEAELKRNSKKLILLTKVKRIVF